MDYQDYYSEALTEPMRWFRMDSDFMRDFKIRLSAEEQTLAEQIIAMIYDQINQPDHNHKVTASLLASLAWHIDGIRHRNAVSRQGRQQVVDMVRLCKLPHTLFYILNRQMS